MANYQTDERRTRPAGRWRGKAWAAPVDPEELNDKEALLRRVEKLADLLDTKFRLPILGYRFGWDSLIGLIPGIGDALTAGLSGYLILEAWRAGAGPGLILRMIYNVAVDSILGAVPLFGDIFDFAYKANAANARLLRDFLRKKHGIEIDDVDYRVVDG